jgi:hypothetical protein
MKSRLSRRKFLGGAAVAIGLPYLESLEAPARGAVACGNRQRFIVGYVPNGIYMPDFTPTTTGKNWIMPYVLEPLESIRSKIAVVTGIDYQDTAEPRDPPGPWGAGTGAFLTMRPVNGNLNDPNRTSLDQRIAADTAACSRPLPSLQLGVQTPGEDCNGAPCEYSMGISWRQNTALPNITDPRAAFDKIFAGFDPSESTLDAEKRKAKQTSILDHCLDEAKALQSILGKDDRATLDQYATAIAQVEKQIQVQGPVGGSCAVPTTLPPTEASPYHERVSVMLQLMALALQCDVTRVVTFMFARSQSTVDFAFLPSIGVPAIHRYLVSHLTAETLRQLREIDRWEMKQWADFLIRLDGMKEADGKSVLDNSLAYFNSEVSDGRAQRHFDMPVLLAGSAGGKLKIDGSHYNYYPKMTFPRGPLGPWNAGDIPVSEVSRSPLTHPPEGAAPQGVHGIKLFVSIMNAFGIPDQTFGDGSFSGPLPDLMI